MDRFESETRERFDALEARMDRFESETRERFDTLDARTNRFENNTRGRFDALEVRFDRFDVDFGTVILDHRRRLEALEGSGGG
jgi:3-dehydroquinate dehydratase